MSISSFAPDGFVEYLNSLKISLFVSGDYHLGDTLTILHHEVFLRKVNQDNADFSAIVGIDCARRVQHGNAFF